MLDRDYPDQVCSIARALEVIGQRWSVLIVRDVFLGRHRFDDLCAGTGITRSLLAARLAEKGRALLPVLTQLMLWGDRYYGEPGGPPLTLEHHDCGGHPQDGLQCDRCGAALTVDDVRARPAGFARRP